MRTELNYQLLKAQVSNMNSKACVHMEGKSVRIGNSNQCMQHKRLIELCVVVEKDVTWKVSRTNSGKVRGCAKLGKNEPTTKYTLSSR